MQPQLDTGDIITGVFATTMRVSVVWRVHAPCGRGQRSTSHNATKPLSGGSRTGMIGQSRFHVTDDKIIIYMETWMCCRQLGSSKASNNHQTAKHNRRPWRACAHSHSCRSSFARRARDCRLAASIGSMRLCSPGRPAFSATRSFSRRQFLATTAVSMHSQEPARDAQAEIDVALIGSGRYAPTYIDIFQYASERHAGIIPCWSVWTSAS